MKIQFKQVAMTLVLSSALLMSGLPALAEGTDATVAQTIAAPVYKISDNLQVAIEGVSSEKTANGVRLGSVIRIINTSNQTLRIPDYELKVKPRMVPCIPYAQAAAMHTGYSRSRKSN